MGRSRGGPTILLKLTEGRAQDGRSADDMLGGLGDGDVLLAGRAYAKLAERCAWAWACVKPMPNRKTIPPFSQCLYCDSNRVERFFNKHKHFRAIGIRYDKRDDNFFASVQRASIRLWLRYNEPVA